MAEIAKYVPFLHNLLFWTGCLILVRVLLTWVGADPAHALVRLLARICDPFLNWLKRRLPFLVQGAWDFSALAAMLILRFFYAQLDLLISRYPPVH